VADGVADSGSEGVEQMVAPDARGSFYEPEPPPHSGGEPMIRAWAQRQFGRISTALRFGRAQFISLDVLEALPEKPFPGMIAYFRAGVATATEGLHEYRSAGTWTKL
jgi:hypothetical protein